MKENKQCIECKGTFYKKYHHSKKYWKTARYCSLECKCKAMKKIFKGRKITWGDKISKARMEHLVSEETRIKIANGHRGKKYTEERKEKMRGKNHPQWKGGRPKCIKCNKQLVNYNSIYCVDCGNRYGKRFRGKDNNQWKGGVSTENDKLRHNPKMKLWRKKVLKKFNSTCQKCKKDKVELHAHHINNFSEFKEQRILVKNGIIFCKGCHTEFHKIFGKKNNNIEQVNEFLTL